MQKIRNANFEYFVYQVVLEGNSIIVINDKDEAEAYIKDMKAHGVSIYLLPVAVFSYPEEKKK